MKLLLISSVIPQETTATELILFRHFAADEIEVAIASDHPAILEDARNIPIYPNPLIKRLTQTRLAPFAHSLQHWSSTFDCRALHTYLENYRPDAIVTVAHGELYHLALQTAQRLRLPLITFFHDWLPDLAWVTPRFRSFLTHRFYKLYQQSHIAFCVSNEMQQHLGDHPNAIVLPPIPEHLALFITPSDLPPRNPFTLTYAGNLCDCYSQPIQQLGIAVRKLPHLQLRLFGQAPDWPEKEIEQFRDWGMYGGFLSRSMLLQRLAESDVLLVVMSFEPYHRKRMETSFPSKLVEYCQLAKPMIIWGPEYCTAVRWAREYAAAEVVTTPDVLALLKTMEQLSKHQNRQQELTGRVRQLADKLFNPIEIQKQFLDALRAVIKTD